MKQDVHIITRLVSAFDERKYPVCPEFRSDSEQHRCCSRQVVLYNAHPPMALLSLVGGEGRAICTYAASTNEMEAKSYMLRPPLHFSLHPDLNPSLSWLLMVPVQSPSSSEEPRACWPMFTPKYCRAAFNHSARLQHKGKASALRTWMLHSSHAAPTEHTPAVGSQPLSVQPTSGPA